MSSPSATACDLLGFLWRLDEFVYKHFRMQAQLALSLILIHRYGLDISEIVGDATKSDPKALHWRDVEIFAIARPCTWRTLVVRLRIPKRIGTVQTEYIVSVVPPSAS
jgi:hypothetical protein